MITIQLRVSKETVRALVGAISREMELCAAVLDGREEGDPADAAGDLSRLSGVFAILNAKLDEIEAELSDTIDGDGDDDARDRCPPRE